MLNLSFGWIWITLGFLSGAALGVGFHRETFMGGYDSWPRRLARLGHIAFFGTGFLNVLAGVTFIVVDADPNAFGWMIVSYAFILGAIAMPMCCFIASRWKHAKPIFVVPVLLLTSAGLAMSIMLALIAVAHTFGDAS